MKSTSQKTAGSTSDNKIPDSEKVHSCSEAVPRINLYGNNISGRCMGLLLCSKATLCYFDFLEVDVNCGIKALMHISFLIS
jgi:hypothetical protein